MKFTAVIANILRKYFPDEVYIFAVNVNNAMKGGSLRVGASLNGVHELTNKGRSIYICRNSRINRYSTGIDAQCAKLASDYHLDKIEMSEGDVFIDCGANIGELGMWASTKHLEYIAIEPEPLEAECCDRNNYSGNALTTRAALWKENGTLTFYSKPETADGSLIEMGNYTGTRSVPAITLDDFVAQRSLGKIKLFKLEAEGAEPEVLLGALKMLKQIEYIAVDCGYERGIAGNHTYIEVDKILRDNNFTLIAAEFKRITFLYKNASEVTVGRPFE